MWVPEQLLWVPEQRLSVAELRLWVPEQRLWPPELVGAKLQMSIGRKCNAFTILYNLASNGIEVGLSEAEEISQKIRDRLAEFEGYYLMDQKELLDFVKEIQR